VLKIALSALALLIAVSLLSGSTKARELTPTAPTFATRAAGADPQVSSNWSGYAATAPVGTTAAAFSDVTASWVQPKVTCIAGRSDSVAFWVGLGGDTATSQALEQLGTEANCNGSGAAPTYNPWWEIVPAASVRIPLQLHAGDHVTAAVLVKGQTVTMSLKNLTRRTRFSKTQTLTQPLDVSSAEWIAEAPTGCSASGRCRALPLTQFGTVAFTDAAATADGHPGTISDPAWVAQPIELIADGSGGRFFGPGDLLGPGVGAVPGALATNGRSFTVAWQQNVEPPPAP
jgi:hypothetical protein